MSRSPGSPAEPGPARPIAIAGFMGSGKSSVSAAVAALTGRTAVDLDRLVEEAAGRAIAEIWAAEGEAGFRRREREALRARLDGPVVVALGGGALSDDEAWALVRSRACTVWLDAPVDLLWERAGLDPARPLAQDRDRFRALHSERLPRYAECDHRLDATRPVAELAREVARLCAG